MQLLGTESFGFQDGTNVPAGPVPAINDCGTIAFRAIVSGGITSRGVIVRAAGVDTWYLKAGDPTPAGGTFTDFQGAALNGSGSIAVFADFNPGTPSSGWFVGRPGAFRKALAFFDPVDGGQCLGLAFSRNPMTPLDDQENLVLWCDLASSGGQDRLLVVDPNGVQTVLARRGAATPIGGTFSSMNAWPSLSSTGHATLSAGTPGASGGAFSAHFASVLCGPGVAASPCAPIGGVLRVDDYGPGATLFVLCVSTATQMLPLPPFGTVLIGPQPLVTLAGPLAYPNGAPHTLTIAIPNNPAFAGAALHFQTLAFGAIPTVLTNRASSVLQ
jgi:hypothetical protein